MELQISHIIYTEIQKEGNIWWIKKGNRRNSKRISNWKGVKAIEAHTCVDHKHMYEAIPPKISVAGYVGFLKGKSTLIIYERHANLKYKYGNKHFWCREYYVDAMGKNEEGDFGNFFEHILAF